MSESTPNPRERHQYIEKRARKSRVDPRNVIIGDLNRDSQIEKGKEDLLRAVVDHDPDEMDAGDVASKLKEFSKKSEEE